MARYKSVDELICKTTSSTFKAYWKELRRHEAALRKIYAKDRQHVHVPEEVGSVNRVHPDRRHIVTFYRCAVCMKDLSDAEVAKLKKASAIAAMP